jgi:N-acetyl-anhydromuramyl-L-alanine amidase AmpD
MTPRLPSAPPKAVVLPTPLTYRASPNQSQRLHGLVPYLIAIHRPVGKYGPSIDWLRNPDSQASAHIITEGKGTGVDVATQLVPWDRKAWACASFNSATYNIEVDDDAWDGDDLGAAFTAARIAAFLCRRTGIPPTWSRHPLHDAGVVRHLDLGLAGGGHSDPTTDAVYWRWFVRQVVREYDRGGFREAWGTGKLVHR